MALSPRDREALSQVTAALPVPVEQVEAALRAALLIGGARLTEPDRAAVKGGLEAMTPPQDPKKPKPQPKTVDERVAVALESIATTLAVTALAGDP